MLLTKLSPSYQNNEIKIYSIWTASYKEAESSRLSKAIVQPIAPQFEAKTIPKSYATHKKTAYKRKLSDTIFSAPEVNKKLDYKELLNEFKQIGIKKYTLLITPSHEKELFRYKAFLANNFALNIIENLSFLNKDISDTKKIYHLQQAQNSFSNSMKFYTQAGLLKEKGKAMQCYNILTSSINSLNEKIISSNKKPRHENSISNDYSHQPTRYTRTFFRKLACPKNDVIQIDNQHRFNN